MRRISYSRSINRGPIKRSFAKRSEIFHKNILDVKICAKLTFITFVNTYSGKYGNRKNVPLVKIKIENYGKVLGVCAIL